MSIPPPLALIPILISLIALWVAVKNYYRKNGIELRGTFQITSSRSCDDQYVSNILIENIKDRAITIFDIYLRVGHAQYIHLVEFEDSPLILKPYETYQKKFGPIEFYSFSLRKVNINNLINNNKLQKRIVLSTSDGKYVIPKHIRGWDPVTKFFKNHLTVILKPIPSRYKDTDLGSNIKYVVDVLDKIGKTQIIPVGRDDHDVHVFRNFKLTRASLTSKAALETFLLERHAEGQFDINDFTVHDVDAWREQHHVHYRGNVVTIASDSFVRYHILGRWFTYLQTRALRRKNKIQKEALAKRA